MSNAKTQHQKLDEVLEITTDIRIRLGIIEERQNNAKEERAEMKEDIKDNAKIRKISNLWDGINTLGVIVGSYFGIRK